MATRQVEVRGAKPRGKSISRTQARNGRGVHRGAELATLQTQNRALTRRLEALQAQLASCEQQCMLLRAQAGGRADELAGRPRAARKTFGAALFASLLGLGLRAVRRAA